MSTGLRALLAALALALAVNAVAHAGHQHDPATAQRTTHNVCAHCATFGSVAPAPAHVVHRFAFAPDHYVAPASNDVDLRDCLLISTQPRAPPAS